MAQISRSFEQGDKSPTPPFSCAHRAHKKVLHPYGFIVAWIRSAATARCWQLGRLAALRDKTAPWAPLAVFLQFLKILLSYFINDNSTLMQLIFLKSVLKMEHFDGYYKPKVNQKSLTNLLLLAVLD